jgi:hypothetical protein
VRAKAGDEIDRDFATFLKNLKVRESQSRDVLAVSVHHGNVQHYQVGIDANHVVVLRLGSARN